MSCLAVSGGFALAVDVGCFWDYACRFFYFMWRRGSELVRRRVGIICVGCGLM